MAQHHGVIPLSPLTRRIIVGPKPTHFFVFVDKAAALAQAQAELRYATERNKAYMVRSSSKNLASHSDPRDHTAGQTRLFSQRLVPPVAHVGLGGEVAEMHAMLRSSVEPATQDALMSLSLSHSLSLSLSLFLSLSLPLSPSLLPLSSPPLSASLLSLSSLPLFSPSVPASFRSATSAPCPRPPQSVHPAMNARRM